MKLAELNARGQSGAGSGGRPLKGLTFFRHQSFPMKPDETKCLIECAGGCTTLPIPSPTQPLYPGHYGNQPSNGSGDMELSVKHACRRGSMGDQSCAKGIHDISLLPQHAHTIHSTQRPYTSGTLKSKPANGTTRILADAPPTDKSLRAYKVHNLDWLKNTVLRNEVSD